MLSESQVDENQLISAGKMLGCTGRSTTRYVIRHLKCIISRSPYFKLCPFYSIIYHNLNSYVILSWRHTRQNKNGLRSLLQSQPPDREDPYNRAAILPDNPASSPSPSPSASATPPVAPTPASPDRNESTSPSALPAPGSPQSESIPSKNNHVKILAGVGSGIVTLLISIIGLYLCKTNKVSTVKPWATGLSGQLQKAFVTGKSKHLSF